MTDFHKDRTIKATRKPYECEQCGRTIEKGSTAIYFSGVCWGDFYSGHVHLECNEAGLAYAKELNLWGEEFPWFQHLEGDADDWLVEKFPIVAERMGIQAEGRSND